MESGSTPFLDARMLCFTVSPELTELRTTDRKLLDWELKCQGFCYSKMTFDRHNTEIHVNIHTVTIHKCTYIHTEKYSHIYTGICTLSQNTNIYMHAHTHTLIYRYTCTDLDTSILIHICYTHILMHTHTHTLI